MKLRSSSSSSSSTSSSPKQKTNGNNVKTTIVKKKNSVKKIYKPTFFLNDDHSCMSNAVMNYFGKNLFTNRIHFVQKQSVSLKKSKKSGNDQWSSLATNFVHDPDTDIWYKREQIFKSFGGNNIMLFTVREVLNKLPDGKYLMDYTYQGKYRQGHCATVSKIDGLFKAISDKLPECERHILPFTKFNLNQLLDKETEENVKISKMKPIRIYSLQIYKYKEVEE
ncbi:hypothetical protein BpHYR1_037508 [Brachionus plicatilis]|uniref:Uncharacterized protein n=1 Tax=Brachionus plicatilis TaxID=10195 RepID=A0A3M7PWP4_BRAPC|nr:hypothetical protein BpHYR1_037508 [Brachionus plicatilis]